MYSVLVEDRRYAGVLLALYRVSKRLSFRDLSSKPIITAGCLDTSDARLA